MEPKRPTYKSPFPLFHAPQSKTNDLTDYIMHLNNIANHLLTTSMIRQASSILCYWNGYVLLQCAELTRYRLRLSMPPTVAALLAASVRAASWLNARSTSTGLPPTTTAGPVPCLHDQRCHVVHSAIVRHALLRSPPCNWLIAQAWGIELRACQR